MTNIVRQQLILLLLIVLTLIQCMSLARLRAMELGGAVTAASSSAPMAAEHRSLPGRQNNGYTANAVSVTNNIIMTFYQSVILLLNCFHGGVYCYVNGNQKVYGRSG